VRLPKHWKALTSHRLRNIRVMGFDSTGTLVYSKDTFWTLGVTESVRWAGKAGSTNISVSCIPLRIYELEWSGYKDPTDRDRWILFNERRDKMLESFRTTHTF